MDPLAPPNKEREAKGTEHTQSLLHHRGGGGGGGQDWSREVQGEGRKERASDRGLCNLNWREGGEKIAAKQVARSHQSQAWSICTSNCLSSSSSSEKKKKIKGRDRPQLTRPQGPLQWWLWRLALTHEPSAARQSTAQHSTAPRWKPRCLTTTPTAPVSSMNCMLDTRHTRLPDRVEI